MPGWSLSLSLTLSESARVAKIGKEEQKTAQISKDFPGGGHNS